jgi:hypothetical protein
MKGPFCGARPGEALLKRKYNVLGPNHLVPFYRQLEQCSYALPLLAPISVSTVAWPPVTAALYTVAVGFGPGYDFQQGNPVALYQQARYFV